MMPPEDGTDFWYPSREPDPGPAAVNTVGLAGRGGGLRRFVRDKNDQWWELGLFVATATAPCSWTELGKCVCGQACWVVRQPEEPRSRAAKIRA